MHFITKSLLRPIFPRPFFNFNKKKQDPTQLDQRQLTSLFGIVTQRRYQGKQLQIKRQKGKFLQNLYAHYDNNSVEFTLYLQHDSTKSHLIFALMNFNNLGFKKVSNIVFLEEMAWMLKDKLKDVKKEARWPLLKAVVSVYPAEILVGEDKIIEWMSENFFFKSIGNNADWVQPAIDFVKKSIEKPLDTLFWNPILTAQLSFDGDATSDRKLGNSYILFKVIRLNVQKAIVNIAKNWYSLLKNKQEYNKSKENFLKGLDQWMSLLNKNEFCGGKQPNLADFYLYAVLKSKWNSRHFRNFIENKTPKQFLAWFRRMSALCRFNPERLTIL